MMTEHDNAYYYVCSDFLFNFWIWNKIKNLLEFRSTSRFKSLPIHHCIITKSFLVLHCIYIDIHIISINCFHMVFLLYFYSFFFSFVNITFSINFMNQLWYYRTSHWRILVATFGKHSDAYRFSISMRTIRRIITQNIEEHYTA